MEYSDTLIKTAESLQNGQDETPYDVEFRDANDLQEYITTLLGFIRNQMHEYHKNHGNIDALSDVLLDAEGGFDEALGEIVGNIENKINAYDPNDCD